MDSNSIMTILPFIALDNFFLGDTNVIYRLNMDNFIVQL